MRRKEEERTKLKVKPLVSDMIEKLEEEDVRLFGCYTVAETETETEANASQKRGRFWTGGPDPTFAASRTCAF